VEHAENASTAAAASAPTLASFIQSPPLDRPAIRATPVGPSWPLHERRERLGTIRPGLDRGGGLRKRRPAAFTTRGAVRAERHESTRARAARRMPPKRCRIICIGGPIAIHRRRDPGVPAEPFARQPVWSRRSGVDMIGTDVTVATAGPVRWHSPAWNT
jgi:hypothetical protein